MPSSRWSLSRVVAFRQLVISRQVLFRATSTCLECADVQITFCLAPSMSALNVKDLSRVTPRYLCKYV